MTRLSDALRGLAERAPLDEASVSVTDAARRVRRGRRLRAAANATAGVGVATVVALAAIHPGGGATPTADDAGGKRSAADAPAVSGAEGLAGGSTLAFGLCGSRPFDAGEPASSSLFFLSLAEFGDDAEGGSTVTADVTLSRSADAGAATMQPPAALVLWDGYVVGTGQAPADSLEAQSAEGDVAWPFDLELVNCWDGAALPGGTYEVVVFEDFYPEASEPSEPVEPEAPAVDPEQGTDPAAPTTVPDEPVVGTAEVDGAGSSDASTTRVGAASDGNTGVVGPAADGPFERAISNHVKLTIVGDAPEDPFGEYLGGTPTVEYPDDYLTPDALRGEYAAHVTTDAWDMAKGTQRTILGSDSKGDPNGELWQSRYFGCGWTDAGDVSFPSESSTWSPLEVTGHVPGSINVRYGWVVDGNPVVSLAATNTSSYSLPGMSGQLNSSILLVKDGHVVAEAYLPTTTPNATVSIEGLGLIEPGASLGGEYLWRDVSGCWGESGQAVITPGTYTVLNVQNVYSDNGFGGGIVKTYTDDAAASVGGVAEGGAEGGAASEPEPRPIIAPAPDQGDYDYVELQVWTSLGTVSVS